MTSASNQDFSGLRWIRAELDETLRQARLQLEDFAEGETDTLQQAVASLHHVYGALSVIQVYGGAMLAEELETLATAMDEGIVADVDQAAEVLMSGLVQLPAYLERLQNGEPDIPLVLLPLMNDLRTMRGVAKVSETSLYAPKLDAVIAAEQVQPGSGNPRLAELIREQRSHYHRGLLQWFRNPDSNEGLKQLRDVVERIAAEAYTPRMRRLLDASEALVVALQEGSVVPDPAVKLLFGNLDRFLKRVIDLGEEAAVAEFPLDLLKSELYYVARSTSEDPVVQAVRRSADLANSFPQMDAEQDSASLGAPGLELFEAVGSALRVDLLDIKDNLDLYMRGSHADFERLEALGEPIRKIADTLAMVGQGDLHARLKPHSTMIAESVAQQQVPTDEQLMDIAGDLLLVESSLGALADQSAGNDDDEAGSTLGTAAIQEHQQALIEQAFVELGRVKDSIMHYLSKPDDSGVLAEAPQRLHSVAGALNMMQQAEAAALLEQLKTYLLGLADGEFSLPGHDLREALADLVIGVEYHMESVIDSKPDHGNALRVASEAAEKLPERADTSEIEADEESAVASDDLSLPDEQIQAAEDAPVLVVEDEAEDTSSDITAVAEVADIEDAVDDVLGDEPATDSSAAKAAPQRHVLEDIDSEILDIFIEEAKEELEVIREHYPRWHDDETDKESLTRIRRSFHTLKGSGRLVGAVEIGEFAWSVENLLNKVIDGAVSVSGPVHELMGAVVDVLPVLIQERETGEGGTSVAHLEEQAFNLADGSLTTAPPVIQPITEPDGDVTDQSEADAVPPESGAEEPVLRLVEPSDAEAEESLELEDDLQVTADASSEAQVDAPEKVDDALDDLPEDELPEAPDLELVDLDAISVVEEAEEHLNDELSDVDLQETSLELEALAIEVDESDEQVLGDVEEIDMSVELVSPEVDADPGVASTDQPASLSVEQSAESADEADFETLATVEESLETESDDVDELELADLSAEPVGELVDADRDSQEDDAIEIQLLEGEDSSLLEELEQAVDFDRDSEDADEVELLGLYETFGQDTDSRAEAAEEDAVAIEPLSEDSDLISEELILDQLSEESDTQESDFVADSTLEDADLDNALADSDEADVILNPPSDFNAPLSEQIESILTPISEEAPPFSVDPTLFDIYSTEARSHLETVAGFVNECRGNAAGCLVNEELTRALHTLRGSSYTAEIMPMADLSASLEAWANLAKEHDVRTNATSIDMLERGHFVLSALLSVVNQPGAAVPEWEQLHKEVQQAVESLEHLNDPQPANGADNTAIEESASLYDSELLEIFMEEANELSEGMERAFVDWSQRPGDLLPVAQLQRDLHTIKGGARMAGISEIGDLAHAMESLFESVVDRRIDGDTEIIKLARHALDSNAVQLDVLSQGRQVASQAGLVERLEAAAKGDAWEPIEVGDSVVDSAVSELLPENEPEPEHDMVSPSPIDADSMLDEDTREVAEGDESFEVSSLFEESQFMTDSELLGDSELSENSVLLGEITVNELDSQLDEDSRIIQFPSQNRSEEPEAEPIRRAPPPEQETVSSTVSNERIRIRSDLLDQLVNNAGEVSIYRARLGQQNNTLGYNLDELSQTMERLRSQMRTLELETEAQILSRYEREHEGEVPEGFDPLEMDQYSTIQQMSRALSETLNDLGSIGVSLQELNRDTDTLLQQQERVTNDLQDGLLRTRMVPVSSRAARLQRVTRQTGQSIGKEVDLSIVGGEGEMDRAILERMIGPLEHLLRNAVAHGIEMPEERLAVDKPEKGTVTLMISREGADVVLTVSDDGRGLNREAIRARALERGLIEEGDKISDDDLDQLILEAGFSTVKEVNQIAGRGVGMDAVLTEIKQLGGTLEIASEPGRGSSFTIRLPFTLAITETLLVKVGEDVYAVPHSSMDGVVRIMHSDLESQYRGEQDGFSYGGRQYSVRYLGAMLNNAVPVLSEGQKWYPLLLVRSGEHRVALQVDALLGNRQIVVKSVGAQLSTVRWFTGGTILADGQIALILDTNALVRMEGAYQIGESVLDAAQEEDFGIKVMVVDDSITVRKVTSRLLERHNMQVITAKDGVDAVAVLQEEHPDVMLLDIEMPRMDGFELARHMRSTDELSDIPIIMITSRTGDKHRNHALDLGVKRYLGKPYQEADLMENIYTVLGEVGE